MGRFKNGRRYRRTIPKRWASDTVKVKGRVETWRFEDLGYRELSKTGHPPPRSKEKITLFDAFMDLMFPRYVMQEVPAKAAVSKERMEAQTKRFFQNVPLQRNIVLRLGKRTSLRLFFAEDSSYWFFVEQRGSMLSRSITYANRDRAYQVHFLGHITWEDHWVVPGLVTK